MVYDPDPYRLRNCPFCGGEAQFQTISTDAAANIARIKFKVLCKKCHAFMPNDYKMEIVLNQNGIIGFYADDRAAAAKAWNGRNDEKR